MILVSGGTGLIGGHLLLSLVEKEQKVRAIYRKKESILKTKRLFELYNRTDFEKIDWVKADLNDISELEVAFDSISEVFHCAALISFSKNAYHAMRKININGTANMVNMSIDKGVKNFFYLSSVAALEKKPKQGLTDENEDWNPETYKNPYAITKYGAEMEVWRGSQEGLNVAIVNPGVVIGPGFYDQGSGKLFSQVKNGMKFYTRGITGFVGVWDVVDVLIKLRERGVFGERFILVSENLSYEKVLFDIADALSVSRPKYYISSPAMLVMYYVSRPFALFSKSLRGMSKEGLMTLNKNNGFDGRKIQQALGFNYTKVSDSIKRTVEVNPI
jgi:nucleoside-diphosphate-sugar epimerase